MSSNSEVSYGARIGNAEKLVAALQNFNGYVPVKPEYSINNYSTLITEIKSENNTVATNKQSYSLAVDNRQRIFDTGDDSIKKLLSPINGAIKVIYGRTAKEATDAAAIIAKIRGANIKKSASTTPNEETVSQSYQSYNSKVQFFSDLIVNLTNFGNNYTPANTTLTVPALTAKYNSAVTANAEVMNTFTQFAQANTVRITKYDLLSQTAIRIKRQRKSPIRLQLHRILTNKRVENIARWRGFKIRAHLKTKSLI